MLARLRLLWAFTTFHVRSAAVTWYKVVRQMANTKMPLDFRRMNICIFETEQELIRVGRERQEFLQKQSQDAALILLLLRCCSLFRAMLTSLRRVSTSLRPVVMEFSEYFHLS
jgi:hypothetical protein